MKTHKLYELPRSTYFRLADEELRDNEVFFLDHIDGSYSYCLNKENQVIHFSCGTLVVLASPSEVYQAFNQTT